MKELKAGAKLRRKGVKPQQVAEHSLKAWQRELEAAELGSRERNPGSSVGVSGRIGCDLWRIIASFAKKGRIAYLSYETLAKMLKASVSAAQEAVQRLVRIGALVIIPQYDWLDGKWVRRPNVYEVRRPRVDAHLMPLFKRVRGVKKAAKDLLAGVQKSFRPRSDVSEPRIEPDRDKNPSECTASSCGAPSARRVDLVSGAPAQPVQMVSSEECSGGSGLEKALALLQARMRTRNAAAA